MATTDLKVANTPSVKFLFPFKREQSNTQHIRVGKGGNPASFPTEGGGGD